jgi:hypothetical protein
MSKHNQGTKASNGFAKISRTFQTVIHADNAKLVLASKMTTPEIVPAHKNPQNSVPFITVYTPSF